MGTKQPLATAPIKTQQPHPDYERFFHTARFSDYIWQIKHDGVRTIFDPYHHEFYSRNGKLYQNFGSFTEGALHLHRWISERIGFSDFCIDGEVAGPNFATVASQLFRKTDASMDGIRYHVFDLTIPHLTFLERNELLRNAFSENLYPSQGIHHIASVKVPNFRTLSGLERFVRGLNERGYEGCVFKRKNAPYLFGKKTQDWVKGILDETLDLDVLKLIPGTGKLEGRVGALLCGLEGAPDNVVEVAPGRASHEELKSWWENPTDAPKKIEVLFKSKTKDGSLRHPRYKIRRDDK